MAKNAKKAMDRVKIDDEAAGIPLEMHPDETAEGAPDPQPVPDRQISLARANKLRNSIAKAIDKTATQIQSAARTQVTVYPGETQKDLDRKLDEAKKEITNLSNTLGILNNIGTALREDIAKANVQSGVSQLMGTIAKVKTILEVYSQIYSGSGRRFGQETEVRSDSQVKYAFERMKTGLENPGLSSLKPESFNVPIYTKDDVQKELEGLKALEKHVSDLEEQRNVLNYSTTIAISEEVCKWLEQAKLL